MSILHEAHDLIHGQRNKDYGHPRVNMTHTAEMFSAYLGVPVTPLDVSALMILLKLSRVHGTGYHHDSLVDIAGYAGVAERVYEEDEDTVPEIQDLDEPEVELPAGDRRVWESLADVPAYLTVLDRDGDEWRYMGGRWRHRNQSGHWVQSHIREYVTKYGPFTEILEDL